MAVITTKQEVCEVCRNTRRKVTRYRVGQDGQLVSVLLCREHGQPLDELIAMGTHVPNQSPRVKVWDLEEIEAERKRQAKTRKQPPGH